MPDVARPRLIISVKRGQFRGEDDLKEAADAEFVAIRPKILQRDNYECVFCGFAPNPERDSSNRMIKGKYQEVHHLDGNHRNSHESNLVTADPLCHAVNHIGHAATKGTAKLIYAFPGMSNADFNQFLRTLLIAYVIGNDTEKAKARKLYAWLESRAVPVEAALGTCSAGVVGQALRASSVAAYSNREYYFDGVRLLLPTRMIEDQIIFWRDTIYKSVTPDTWKLAINNGSIFKDGTPPLWLRDI